MQEQIKKKKRKNMSSFRIIILSFFSLIMVGTLLLMLPISSRERVFTPFADALFTATSATCVTGLIVRDTATYWSFFGQAVIITLIQIGGMGVITIGLTIMRASGMKIGLWHRSMMKESVSAHTVGGMVRYSGFIIKTSLLIELIGAALMFPVFCRDFGVLKGIWYSFFHSISAFCNAYGSNIYLNTIIMLLIIAGGIGFLVWGDLKTNLFRFKRYSLQTKVVLITTLFLIVVPAIYFFFCEYGNLNMSDRILSSFFQSVTTRTAGFNSTDLTQMSESGIAVMIILMLIGGSPGSTAGGMKTVTIAVLFLAAVAVFGRKKDIQTFKRRIADDAVRNAGAILFMYFALCFVSAVVISQVEHIPLLTCMFETSSGVGTVGLTLGITTKLGLMSRIILMVLMFFGRVGGLTLIYAALPSSGNTKSRLPLEKISIG